jgi:hypothetical protein
MADGYIIEITNPPVAEDKPLKEIWYAHIPDRKRALKPVRKAARAAKDAAVDIVRPERHKILLERLALLEGEVRPE